MRLCRQYMLLNTEKIPLSLTLGLHRYQKSFSTSNFDPLRILFCGSEEFSIYSLSALYNEQRRDPGSIASIDVVCRPGKPVGRGLQKVREVPIAAEARRLALSLHQIDTFTRWELPKPGGKDINLIIAVSFGLFVPPRLLDAVRYGGLNVHPSLLPEFRGPAPLHRTLLSGCRRTGVTLQTLHPKNFDHGVILDQTSYPGFEHNSQNVDELKSITGQRGAEMLVQSIQKRTFVPPLRDVGWCNGNETAQSLRRAPKITTEDRHINWGSWSAAEILKRQQIIGPLWSIMEGSVGGQGHEKRIIWAQGFELAPENVHIFSRAGHPVIFAHHSKFPQIFIRTCDGITLTVNKIKIEGRRSSDAISSMVYAGMLTLPEDINKSSYQPTASISPLR